MKKNRTFLLGTLAVLSFFMMGCEKENNNAELIRGLWVNTLVDGHAVLTDEVFVIDFKTDNTELYALGVKINENNEMWQENTNYTYSVKGDVITINGTDGQNNTVHMEFQIISLNKEILTYSVKTFSINGEVDPDSRIYTCKRVVKEFKSEFIGVWFGHCTSAGAPDNSYHYWEYFADGTYNYYYQDEDQNWIKISEVEDHYYLYGNFLATKFVLDLPGGGTEMTYECWNINIAGAEMIWTGLRKNNTTITFEMEKVTSPPPSK